MTASDYNFNTVTGLGILTQVLSVSIDSEYQQHTILKIISYLTASNVMQQLSVIPQIVNSETRQSTQAFACLKQLCKYLEWGEFYDSLKEFIFDHRIQIDFDEIN